MSKRKKPPMQPVVFADGGVIRFQRNVLVTHLLDAGGIDMNQLALIPCPRSDREQFAQLIGYSVSGFNGLSYVSKKSAAKADRKVAKLKKE